MGRKIPRRYFLIPRPSAKIPISHGPGLKKPFPQGPPPWKNPAKAKENPEAPKKIGRDAFFLGPAGN